MNESIIRISNLLNFTRQEFDIYEQRLLILVLEQLKQKQGIGIDIENGRNLEISLHYSDFEQDLTTNRLRTLAETITSRKLYYQATQEKWTYIVLFPIVTYDKGEFKITIIDKAIRYLLELAKGYTNLDKKSIFALRSTISIRMYELLSAYKKDKNWTVNIDNLRDYLNLKHSQYVNFKDFRLRILEYSQKELLEHTDIYFTWDIAAKQRKKITALTFYITTKDKQEKIELDNEIKQSIDFISQLNPLEIAQKVQMASAKYTLTPEQVEYIISDSKVFNEFIRIDLIIETMIEKQKPPKDRTKYLAKSLGLDKVKFKK